MQYWRMQMHPADPKHAIRYIVESLGIGLIGLDFAQDVGDIRRLDKMTLPTSERDFVEFALTMKPQDRVLIVAHHFPFAVVTVSGDYNYISTPEAELGVWFRHFRRIDKARTKYLADYQTNLREWEQVRMTDTISVLKDPASKSYKLINEVCGAID